MLDNDNLTYSYQKRIVNNDARQAERALITLERSQKLDLLIHLLTNLQQSLLVCGPTGIGKTTLLQTLHDTRKDVWQLCLLPGSSALSFESIINQLSQFLNLSGSGIHFDLSSLRAFCAKQKVVLLIDDAGELMPGLIGELVDFAESLPGLRLVLAMTHEQFHQQSATDKALDGCHLLELPPLTQKQCLEYLQNLSAQPGALLSFNAVTDALVEELYRQTQGVPGKILAELPKFEDYQAQQSRKLGLWFGLLIIVAAAGFVAKKWLPSDLLEPSTSNVAEVSPQTSVETAPSSTAPVETTQPTIEATLPIKLPQLEPPSPSVELATVSATRPTPVIAPAAVTEPAIVPQTPPITQPTTQPATPPVAEAIPPFDPAELKRSLNSAETKLDASSNGIAENPVLNSTAVTPTSPVLPAVKEAAAPTESAPPKVQPAGEKKPLPAKPTGNANLDDLEWIKAQPANNYTLQVMVLSSKVSVLRFLRKYADYRGDLKYYSIGNESQEKYVLIYGSFPTAIEASKIKAALPAEFNRGLEKRFRAIQKESRH